MRGFGKRDSIDAMPGLRVMSQGQMVASGFDIRCEGDAESEVAETKISLSKPPLNLLVPSTAHCFYPRLEMKVKAGAGPLGCHRERGIENRVLRIFKT